MIFTLTGNLLWERTFTFADWAPGRTQRATGETVQVGGKGINVSKMLTRLGVLNTALCFAGGGTGAACAAWLEARGVAFRSFAADRPTRAGLVIRGGAQPETVFLGPDAPPGPAAVRACAAFLEAQRDGSTLAICGSLPGWETGDSDPLRAALENWFRRGTVVADTYGPPLAWLADRPLALAKINRTEFDGLFPPAGSRGDLPARLQRARAGRPVRAWVVTDGPGPLCLADEKGEAATLTPPAVREISATGSGDVLLACLLQSFAGGVLPLREAVAQALPYAAANAAHPGIAEFRLPAK